MGIFANLRLLVLLRRAAIALESLAASQRTLASIATARQERIAQHHASPHKPSKVELGFMDTDEIERRYQDRLKRERMDLE